MKPFGELLIFLAFLFCTAKAARAQDVSGGPLGAPNGQIPFALGPSSFSPSTVTNPSAFGSPAAPTSPTGLLGAGYSGLANPGLFLNPGASGNPIPPTSPKGFTSTTP